MAGLLRGWCVDFWMEKQSVGKLILPPPLEDVLFASLTVFDQGVFVFYFFFLLLHVSTFFLVVDEFWCCIPW